MRNIEIGGYIRISKKEAEKRDIMPGKLFACALARCHRSMCGGVYVDCQKEEFPHIGNDGFNTIVPRNREFETVVNAFRRYNCNYEIGYYPAYYVKAVQL